MTAPNVDSVDSDREPHGIIETVGLTFALLNRRPYLVWPLIVVDLIRWTGVRVQLADPMEPIMALLQAIVPGSPSWPERIGDVELLGVMSWLLPTLIEPERIDEHALPVAAGVFQVDQGLSGVLMIAGVVTAIALFIGFLTQLGRLVTNQPVRPINFARDIWNTMYRSLAAVSTVGGLIAFMMLPFVVIGAGLWIIGVDPIVLLSLSLLLLAGWLGLFFIFSIPALALGETRIFRALRSSYRITQEHFLAVVGIIFIVFIIRAGTPHALSPFMDSQWSIPFAIVANAYIATGLIASLLYFFHHQSNQHPTVNECSTSATSG